MWQIKYYPKALKTLNNLDKSTGKKISNYLEQIAESPKSFGKPLIANLKGYWRYRVGDYRIICDLVEEESVVSVAKIDHRSKVYE